MSKLVHCAAVTFALLIAAAGGANAQEKYPTKPIRLIVPIWGPKGLPEDIVARWNKGVSRVLQTDEMTSRMAGEGVQPAGGPPAQFLNTIRRDVEKWKRVVKEAKISLAP